MSSWKVTRANKETINADKVYSMMSLLANNKTDDEMGNITNFDVVSSKIENNETRVCTTTHVVYKSKEAFTACKRHLRQRSSQAIRHGGRLSKPIS